MSEYVLKLYITGKTPRAERALTNLQRVCDVQLPGATLRIEVIDVLEQPQLADRAHILATPTVIKEQPLPSRRVIGDLSSVEKVVLGLDLKTRSPKHDPSR